MTSVNPPPYRIYLLRHAKSGWPKPGGRDFDRELDDDGYAEAEIVAEKAADKNYRPDLVVSSTAARCRQTVDALHRAFGGELELRFVDELYNAPADNYLEILAALREFSSVMLVGHNPAIEEVLATLVGIDAVNEHIPHGYPTAGLAVIDYVGEARTAGDRMWKLVDFLTEESSIG